MRTSIPLVALAACTNTTTVTLTEPAVTHTVTNTVVEQVTVADDDLDPGHFLSPLVQLVKVLDDNGASGTHGVLEDHMHVDEVKHRESDDKLFYCGYTFGTIDVSNPADAEYLAQGYEWDLDSPVDRMTGCLHLDWDDEDPDIVYVTHRGNIDFQPHLSVVDLGSFAPDPKEPDELELAPVLAPSLQEPDTSYEGVDYEDGLVYVALHEGGLGVFQRDPATNEMTRVATYDQPYDNLYDVYVVGSLAFLLDELAGLSVVDVSDLGDIHEVGALSLSSINRDITVEGQYAYLAAGELGLVIVDVSDPAAPMVVSQTPAYGTAVRVGVDGDRVALAAWTDTRVYDVTDRGAPSLIGAVRLETTKDYAVDDGDRPDITARTFGVDLHGDFLFVGNWWTPYTFEVFPERKAPYLVVPEDAFYMGFGTAEVGETLTYDLELQNDGTAPLTVYDLWLSNPAFTVAPVGAVLQPGEEARFTLTYTATTTEEESAILNILSDDPSQPVRKGYAVGNAIGVGVGDPLPYTEATDVNTLAAWTSGEMAGKVGLVAYFANYCPVCGVHMPDLQTQFAEEYPDLYIVGMNPDSDDYEDIPGVASYVSQMGISYPITVQETAVSPTYSSLEITYDGANPFPLDVLVDKNGIIRYISREYDPPTLHEKVQELLAE